ncbi:WD40 repeat domain-containing serine/threonine protein kinase [Nonomuraea maritima]|uniref:WD40 repeat domain-containing serine/threonine protein kinase n=1 Tax=Nonomuraea maritima TaxID=683260 RepID=UPI00371D08CB
MRLVPGDPERLGGFWLAARLGAGARGVVYDAYDDEGRRFAVTVPRAPTREAHRFAQLTCRHLARVVAAGADAGIPYLVSEFVDGPDLRRAVELHGPYTGDELVALAAALASALRALHEAGLTHRGLDPCGVLLASGGPKLIELGLEAETSLAGSYTYLAPEVVTGQEPDAAADVFAWGAVVMFAATGRDPFHGDSLGGVMHQLLAVDPDPSGLPASLCELVGRALAKDPADRPAASELLVESATALSTPDGHVRAPSLGERAELVYLSLSPTQQQEVPSLLLRLLDGDSPHDEGDVLRPLMEGGLVVRRSVRVPPAETPVGKLVAVSDDRVSPVSAALYRAWPRLRRWVADERDGLAAHRRIREAARRWSDHRRGRGRLLRGRELDAALGWAATKRRHVRLNQLERDFIADSLTMSRQRRRLLAPSLAAMGALLAVAVTMSVVSVQGQNDLRGRLLEADARAVAARAEALRSSDPRTAMRLSVAAWRLSPELEARVALQASLVQPELAVFTAPGTGGTHRLHGDDLLRWDAGAVTVWDVAGGQRAASYPLPPGTRAVSDDGRFAEGADGKPFEVATGRAPGATVFAISKGNRTTVYDGTRVLFDVTDRRVAVAPGGSTVAMSALDGQVELWEVTPERARAGVVRVEPLTGADAAAPALAFSPSGGTLAVAGRDGVTLVETPSPRPAASSQPPQPASVRTRPMEPSGAVPASVQHAKAADGEPHELHEFHVTRLTPAPAAGKSPPREPVVQKQEATGWGVEMLDGVETVPGASAGWLAFSPDGRLLALPGDGEVQVWNVADHHLTGAYPLRGQAGGLAFSSDGRVLRYLTATGSVVSLDVSGLPSPSGDDHVAAFSGDGRVAAQEVGNAIELTDAVSRRALGRIDASGDLAFDATGRLLAVAGDPVTVWQVADGRRVASVAAGGAVLAVALSPDGRTLATARGSVLETWDVRTGHRIAAYEGAGDPALAFSPDGTTLAAGARLVDLRTGQVTPLERAARAGAQGETTALAFSSDGRRLAFGLRNGRVLLWDVRTRRSLGTIETGPSEVDELRFSPAGDLLAVDATRTSLWDTRTLRETGQVGAWAGGLAFSQDGRRLRGVTLDGAVRETAVDPALAAQEVCARAGGPLSKAEWSRLIPESGYRKIC